jgi:NAD(P)H-dependent FMN reductase
MSERLVVALDGAPLPGSSVHRMTAAVLAGAAEAGAVTEHLRCVELRVAPCLACGPEPTDGLCVLHDDMDRVYALLERAHAVVVASPVYFDTVSAPLKAVMDRCNCVTPLVRQPDGGYGFRPRWTRTRRGLFVTACSAAHRFDPAERSVRGFLKWIGARWEETLAWQHDDVEMGSVTRVPELLARARAAGWRVAGSAPLVDAEVAGRDA